MPLVSVVMPSYNHDKFISESVRSVLNQSLGDLELVIVDDASIDRSRAVIEDFARRDQRIRCVFHSANLGIARSVNDGISEARGRFIAFTASDDVWCEDKLARQIQVLQSNEDLVVWAEGEVIDAEGRPTGELFTAKHGASKKKKTGRILHELLEGSFIFGSALVFLRRNIDDIRYDASLKYLNDYQFHVDLAARYEYFFIPQPLAKYRTHGANTNVDRLGYSEDSLLVGERFLKEYGNAVPNRVRSRIYLNMARAHFNLGNRGKAIECALSVLRLDPSPQLIGLLSQEAVMHISKRLRRP